MATPLRFIFPVLVYGLCLSAGYRQTLAIESGEWAVATTFQIQGSFLGPDALARLAPQERARLEAVMTARAGQLRQPQTHHVCLTAES